VLLDAKGKGMTSEDFAEMLGALRDAGTKDLAFIIGGPDGLDFYRRIAGDGRSHLTAGGALIVEIGQGQATDVAAIFRAAGLGEIAVLNDLAGIQRVVQARSP